MGVWLKSSFKQEYTFLNKQFAGKSILYISHGYRKFPGAIAVDIKNNSNSDIICDLNRVPWPFPYNSFDLIICQRVIEDFLYLAKTMEELYRIVKPNGLVVVEYVHFSSCWAYSSSGPSFHYYSSLVFRDFHSKQDIHKAKFQIVKRIILFDGIFKKLSGVQLFANLAPYFYETNLVYLFPASSVYVELRAVK